MNSKSTGIDYTSLTYIMDKPLSKRSAEKLRGFFGSKYRDNNLFHNHDQAGKSIYRYPLIQYKLIDGNLSIIGLSEGAAFIKEEFVQYDALELGAARYDRFEIRLITRQVEFNISDSLHRYRFDSIWLPLNHKNYDLYQRGKLDLNIALRNNLLSDLKGLGVWVDSQIMVNGQFSPREVELDNTVMTGFVGEFVCNLQIPDYVGTGKRKSIGFGTIISVE